MKTALVCLGDLHLTDKPTKHCTVKDVQFLNLQMSLLDKVTKHVKKLSKTHVVAVILPGDIFDHWNASPRVVTQLSNWVSDLYAMGCPTFGTHGQHEVRAHAFSTWKENSYLPLTGVFFFINEVYNFDGVKIAAVPYSPGVEGYLKARDEIGEADVIIWHVSASPNPAPEIAHIRDIPMDSGKVVICGDIHNFQETYKHNDTVFVSQGALLPMNVGEWVSGNKSGMHTVYFEDKKLDRIEWTELTSDLMPTDLYDTRVLLDVELSEEIEKSAENLKERLEQMKKETSISDEALLRMIAGKLDVNPLALDLALDMVRVQ